MLRVVFTLFVFIDAIHVVSLLINLQQSGGVGWQYVVSDDQIEQNCGRSPCRYVAFRLYELVRVAGIIDIICSNYSYVKLIGTSESSTATWPRALKRSRSKV